MSRLMVHGPAYVEIHELMKATRAAGPWEAGGVTPPTDA